MDEGIFQYAGIIVLIGAVVYAFHLVWTHLVKPVVKALKALGEFIEAQPTLLEIAHEFKKNDGNTLRDQVDLMKIQISNIEQSVEQLVVQAKQWDGSERRNTT